MTTKKTVTQTKKTSEKTNKTIPKKVNSTKKSITKKVSEKTNGVKKIIKENLDNKINLDDKKNLESRIKEIINDQRDSYALVINDGFSILEFKINWETKQLLYSRGNTKNGSENYKLIWNSIKKALKDERVAFIEEKKLELSNLSKEEIKELKKKEKKEALEKAKKESEQLAKEKADSEKEISKEKERKKLINSKNIFKEHNEIALSLKNVKKSYGFKKVLKGVTFEIKKGERLALIGKNGAGKSTLINIIAQQTKLSEGEIRYGYASNRVQSLERMGIQFQSLNYPEGFIVKDVIKFFNSSVDKSIRMSNRELSDMISMFGIDKFLNQAIDRLSGGQQQRINILLALIKKPHLLILDEISTGLDVESSEVIKGYIEQYLKKYPETALLLISHSDEEIREMAERVVVLDAGKIAENFPAKKLTLEMFMEITSREPKLTKREISKIENESKRHLRQLRRRYVERKENIITQWVNSLKNKFDNQFAYIDNSKIDENNSVEIRDVSKTYGKTVGAVRNFSLDIEKGSRIAITGPNGSGKSTVVEIIAQVKNADNIKNKYSNMKNLAKADYQRELSQLEENLKVTLRQQKNKYRLERELAYNDAKDITSNLNSLAKEAKEKDKKGKTLKEIKDSLSLKAQKILDKADKAAEKARLSIEENKLILEEQKEKDIEITLSKFNKKIEDIKEQEKKWNKDNSYRHSEPFVLNGKKIKAKEYNSEKPSFAYSFAETSVQVRDNVGVQFQYASFPVEMSVLDVLLFFSRTNKFFMTKAEIIEAVKIFKLEKLLKAKAYSLSGGERQRLNVLLAIMKSPKLLILDEISTGLDVDSVVKIDAFIKDYLNKTNATLILISHNYHEVHSLTDKIVVMKYGVLTEIVDTKDWEIEQTKEKMRDIYKGGAV